jgi:hypothetical protein
MLCINIQNFCNLLNGSPIIIIIILFKNSKVYIVNINYYHKHENYQMLKLNSQHAWALQFQIK